MDLFGDTLPAAYDPRAAGVDEVGRGPLAGPVVAGAVVLKPADEIAGLNYSKLLEASEREALAGLIKERSVAWGLGRAEAEEIDQMNILRATFLAMQRAVDALGVDVSLAYVDGNMTPPLECPTVAIVGGDGLVPAISAASIIAKVARDGEMSRWSAQYPQYGFDRHKGYATSEHLAALQRYGPTPLHRRSFAPLTERGGAGAMALPLPVDGE